MTIATAVPCEGCGTYEKKVNSRHRCPHDCCQLLILMEVAHFIAHSAAARSDRCTNLCFLSSLFLWSRNRTSRTDASSRISRRLIIQFSLILTLMQCGPLRVSLSAAHDRSSRTDRHILYTLLLDVSVYLDRTYCVLVLYNTNAASVV